MGWLWALALLTEAGPLKMDYVFRDGCLKSILRDTHFLVVFVNKATSYKSHCVFGDKYSL